MLQAASTCFETRDQLAWSLVASALALSGFSAVVAAFMFAGMILLLTREVREYARGKVRVAVDPQIGRPIAFMFASFFSLVMAAFLFAAMTGEESERSNPRQFVEGALPALVLTVGVVQMAVGLAWLLRVRNLAGVPSDIARMVVHATVVLAGFFLSGVVVSPVLQSLVHLGSGLTSWGAWAILMALVVAAIPLGAFLRGPLHRQLGHDRVIRIVNMGSVVLAVTAALAWSVLTSVSRCVVLPLYDTGLGNVVVLLGFVAVMLMLASLEVAAPGREQPLHGLR